MAGRCGMAERGRPRSGEVLRGSGTGSEDMTMFGMGAQGSAWDGMARTMRSRATHKCYKAMVAR